MKEQKLIIGIVVGYMLKVMKANKKGLKFKKEFACIRHGNYPKFISLIKGEIPLMVVYNSGIIESNPSPKENNYDFVGLIMAGPSMKNFYQKCAKEYGVFDDANNISNEIFYKIAIYEITIRLFANKFKTLNESEKLCSIITNLGKYLKLEPSEVEIIQKGRKLLNMIKHGKKKNYTWEEGQLDFNNAFNFMVEKKITIE
jgi:hypothetical protein